MAKARSQNKIAPEQHKILQPSSRKVNKNKKSNEMKIKDFKIVLTRLSREEIEKSFNKINLIDSKEITPQLSKKNNLEKFKQETVISEPAYSLRKRENVKCSTEQLVIEGSKTKEIAVKKPVVTIGALFNICKRSHNNDLVIGQLVLAKMQTYSPWPAKVMEIKDKKVIVFFFGTNNHDTVKKVDCIPIQFCGPVILQLFESKQANLQKAIAEMKLILQLAKSTNYIP